MPPKKATSPTEGTRRSSRVVPAPAAKVAKAPAKAVPKKAAAPKKRAKAEIESEDDEEDDESEDEKPKRKKVRTGIDAFVGAGKWLNRFLTTIGQSDEEGTC